MLDNACKPFLRWAGGKTWLLKYLDEYIPNSGFNKYHEPFLGGGSVYFFLRPNIAFLTDLNPELIEVYSSIRDEVEKVISELRKFENTKECYYLVREGKFRSSAKRAARFIYLNQTSFNGIYRVNLQGKYNVPYGYRKKDFFEPENLRNVSQSLQPAILQQADFRDTISNIEKGDLVFLDPPYTVTHNHNGFIKYNDKLFDLKAQYSLSEYIDQLKDKGAYYILTNAAHSRIREIFTKTGDKAIDVGRTSRVGGKYAKRGIYYESIFSNIIN